MVIFHRCERLPEGKWDFRHGNPNMIVGISFFCGRLQVLDAEGEILGVHGVVSKMVDW